MRGKRGEEMFHVLLYMKGMDQWKNMNALMSLLSMIFPSKNSHGHFYCHASPILMSQLIWAMFASFLLMNSQFYLHQRSRVGSKGSSVFELVYCILLFDNPSHFFKLLRCEIYFAITASNSFAKWTMRGKP